MLRLRQGNWGLKCAAVQDRALKLYPGSGWVKVKLVAQVRIGGDGERILKIRYFISITLKLSIYMNNHK